MTAIPSIDLPSWRADLGGELRCRRVIGAPWVNCWNVSVQLDRLMIASIPPQDTSASGCVSARMAALCGGRSLILWAHGSGALGFCSGRRSRCHSQ